MLRGGVLKSQQGKANGPSSYLAWAGAMHTTMGARYGPKAKVFTDQVPYVVPHFEADDVPQADDPGMEVFRLPTSMQFEYRR